MAEYIDREAAEKAFAAEADKLKVGESDALAGLYTASCVVRNLPPADVVPAKELAERDQEIKRLQAEVDRLHKENFWLTRGGDGK